jgi:hypothetical protein
MISRVLVVASLVVACASCASPRPTREAIETRLAVDGSATFEGMPELVRAATISALHKLGHELEDGESLTTKPRTVKVGRWRWARVTNPEATTAATVGAALTHGGIPTDAEVQGTPSDAEISVSYTFELLPSGDDGLATTVIARPRATLEGSDVTDEYLSVLGPDAARRRFDEIFDAIRAEVSAPTPAGQ